MLQLKIAQKLLLLLLDDDDDDGIEMEAGLQLHFPKYPVSDSCCRAAGYT